jgi:predicted small lipoprotein YifL
MIRPILLVSSLLILAACGDKPAAEAPPAVQQAAARQKTVFDDQLKALEKAKAVEKEMQEAQEKRDQAMKDQGG